MSTYLNATISSHLRHELPDNFHRLLHRGEFKDIRLRPYRRHRFPGHRSCHRKYIWCPTIYMVILPGQVFLQESLWDPDLPPDDAHSFSAECPTNAKRAPPENLLQHDSLPNFLM